MIFFDKSYFSLKKEAAAENMAKPPESSIFRGLNFDISVFQMADDELRIDDKVSLIFLLFEDSSEALIKATLVIESQDTSHKDILLLWAKNCGLLWRQKFLEALLIIKCFGLINNILDLDLQTVHQYYPMDSFQTAFIHPIKKCLYAMSEAMVPEETDKVLNEFKNVFDAETMMIEGTDTIYFEIFILKLIKSGFMKLGTWNCKAFNPDTLNKASVEGLTFILLHLNFIELYDLLSAIECKFNKLIRQSRQPNHGFEFEEDQEIMAARLSFNSWVQKGLTTEITKLRPSFSNDEGEFQPGSSSSQSASHVEGNLETVLKHEAQDINKESQNNDDVIGELIHSLSQVEILESSNQNLPIGVTCGERLQKAADLQQGHEESMDLVEELKNMDLGDENSNDFTQGPSTFIARGESYSISTDVPRIYLFNNCFKFECNPPQAKRFEERPNAVNEEEYVTNAFKSLNFNDYVLQNLNHCEIEDAFTCTYVDKLKENPSIFVFFMVCYGFNGYMVSPNGQLVRREYIERLIVKIPELVGKPKILIIQTYMLDDVRFPEQLTEQGLHMVDLFSLWVPIPYHVQEGGGRSLFESELPGVSMFVKTFCDHLEVMDSNKDFVSYCCDVCSEVMNKTNGALMPTYVSYLSKLLYLK